MRLFLCSVRMGLPATIASPQQGDGDRQESTDAQDDQQRRPDRLNELHGYEHRRRTD